MSTRQIIEIAMFTAVAVVLTMVSIPMPIPAMSELGLKIDISVVFIYIIFVRQGNKAGFISLLITMTLNELVKSSPYFIAAIAYSMAFIVFYFSYQHKHLVRAIVVTAIVMTIANFFVITPVYTAAYGGLPAPYFEWIFTKEYLWMIITIYPLFNAIQWTINGLLIKVVSRETKTTK